MKRLSPFPRHFWLLALLLSCVARPNPVPGISFTADTDLISPGGAALLRWQVIAAQEVSVDNGVGLVASEGETYVKPSATTTFTLTARNSSGKTSATLTIHVGGQVSVLAGVPSGQGSTEGVGLAARFNRPFALAVDASGNVYVADTNNFDIRRIDATGRVEAYAGRAGTTGDADGIGTAARFLRPTGMAIDRSGHLYVSEEDANRIRMIDLATNSVTTPAGSYYMPGSADGQLSDAQFQGPLGLAVDEVDNLYVADAGNHTIRKITPEGEVSTYAGAAGEEGSDDGPRSSARFSHPAGVAADGSGNVYVADTGNHTIRKISSDGTVSTLAGMAGLPGSADGSGATASFSSPSAILIDRAGNLLVADSANHTIRRVTPVGIASTVAGHPGKIGNSDGSGAQGLFFEPKGLAIGESGDVYVADSRNNAVRRIDSNGDLATFAGVVSEIGSADGFGAAARFYYPAGIAVAPSGSMYVADSENHVIRKITDTGQVTTLAGTAGQCGSVDGVGVAAQFCDPTGVAVDAFENVYVADYDTSVIRKITAKGEVTTLAGKAKKCGSNDGPGDEARFCNPTGVAVDGFGDVYVADTRNHVVRKITAGGEVTTLAGTAGQQGYVDASGPLAQFDWPVGITVDGSGNVYVSEYNNCTIRKVAPNGEVTTVAGDGQPGFRDGDRSVAQFGMPAGLISDTSGTLYVADTMANTIRRVTAGGDVTTVAGQTSPTGNLFDTTPASLIEPGWVAIGPNHSLYVVLASAVLRVDGVP